MAAGLFVRHLSASTTLFSLLRTSPLSWLWNACLPSMSRYILFVPLLCIDCQHFVSCPSTYSRRALHGLCSASKLCCAATTFFLISSMRPVASSSPSLLLKRVSSLSPSSSLTLPFLFPAVAAFSNMSNRSASLVALFPQPQKTTHLSFLSLLRRALCSPQRLIHFPFGVARSQATTELCPPLLPTGCCHLCFMEPHDSLLLHLSVVSVTAFLIIAVVFLTLDFFLLLSGEHEDDRDSLCVVLGSKRGRGLRCLRSFIHYCTVPYHHLHVRE